MIEDKQRAVFPSSGLVETVSLKAENLGFSVAHVGLSSLNAFLEKILKHLNYINNLSRIF